MKYSFVNTRLRVRMVKTATQRARRLFESGSANEIMQFLALFGIKDMKLSLPDADIVINSYFKDEARTVANSVRTSKFLYLFCKRFEIFELMNAVTNINKDKIGGRIVGRATMTELAAGSDIRAVISAINMKYGFKINQDATVTELREAILIQYLTKLKRLAGLKSKQIVEREITLRQALKGLVGTSPSEDDESHGWVYKVLKTDPNVADLHTIYYLLRKSEAAAVSTPLSEQLVMSYIYAMELNYNLVKALFFNVKKGIKLEAEGIWQT